MADLAQADRRQIDINIVQRQGFAVIHVLTPLHPEEVPPEEERHSSPEYKVIDKIVRKYSGVFTVETLDEGFCAKIELPLAQ